MNNYSMVKQDQLQSSLAAGNISEDEDEHGQRKVAEGLGKIKESYNDLKNAYAEGTTLTSQQKEVKVAETLG